MIEVFLNVCVPLLFVSLVLAIIRKSWFVLRWRMGWRPNILDQSLVKECVDLCSQSVLETTARHVEETQDYIMTESDKEEYLEETTKVFRAVVEDYIFRFSLNRA